MFWYSVTFLHMWHTCHSFFQTSVCRITLIILNLAVNQTKSEALNLLFKGLRRIQLSAANFDFKLLKHLIHCQKVISKQFLVNYTVNIFLFVWNPVVHHFVHKSPQWDSVLVQLVSYTLFPLISVLILFLNLHLHLLSHIFL